MKAYEALLMAVSTLLGGGVLGYLILPKKDRVKFEEVLRRELYERLKHVEEVVDEQNKKLLWQATEIGKLRAEVAACKELHRANNPE